jgi:hypothetical protein
MGTRAYRFVGGHDCDAGVQMGVAERAAGRSEDEVEDEEWMDGMAGKMALRTDGSQRKGKGREATGDPERIVWMDSGVRRSGFG